MKIEKVVAKGILDTCKKVGIDEIDGETRGRDFYLDEWEYEDEDEEEDDDEPGVDPESTSRKVESSGREVSGCRRFRRSGCRRSDRGLR